MRPKFPLALFLALTAGAHAASVQVDSSYFSDGSTNPLVDNNGIGLTAGTAANGDGAVFQIGYLAGVDLGLDPNSYGDAEWGAFVPIAGGGVNPSGGMTTIGDMDSGAAGPFGFYGVSVFLDDTTDANLPPGAGYPQQLAIRFYNGTSIAGSTHFNTVVSDTSEWELTPLPAVPSPGDENTLDLDGDVLVWQGTPFRTDIAIPEPSSSLLALLGALIFLRRRR